MHGTMHARAADLAGEHHIVTGGNRGIGFGTVLALARRGARVTIACRSRRSGEEAVALVLRDCPGASVQVGEVDVADLESVRAFARWLGDEPVHALVNNAGANFWSPTRCSDGSCKTLRTNVLGPFLLTRLLEANLRAAAAPGRCARVVNVASVMHREPGVEEELRALLRAPRPWQATAGYSASKACNVVLAHETQRRWRAAGICARAVDPGAAYSNIWATCPQGSWLRAVDCVLRLCYAPVVDGGQAAAAAAAGDVDGEAAEGGGAPYCARGLFATPLVRGAAWRPAPLLVLLASLLDWPLRKWTGRGTHVVAVPPAAYTLDEELGGALWARASEGVGCGASGAGAG